MKGAAAAHARDCEHHEVRSTEVAAEAAELVRRLGSMQVLELLYTYIYICI